MRWPKLTLLEEMVLAGAFTREMRGRSTPDNRAAEESLEVALWEVACFQMAVTKRKKARR